MQLTLVVPELIWPEPEDRDVLADLACPALETLLMRGRQTSQPPQSLEATLADRFGHPEGAPYGAFRLLGETESSLEIEEKSWLIADPVHLRFHQERLILADGTSYAIDPGGEVFRRTTASEWSDTGIRGNQLVTTPTRAFAVGPDVIVTVP